MNIIIITNEMKEKARFEAARREQHGHIQHHFNVKHFSEEKRNEVGFLGEFAVAQMFGLDWMNNIRENYYSIDNGDFHFGNVIVDVKTETIPKSILINLLNNRIRDNQPYGRRLIAEQQVRLLNKYNFIVFGAFPREANFDAWYSLGYLSTDYIIKNYDIVRNTPFGTMYPNPCINVKQSDLLPIQQLLSTLNFL